MNVKQKSILVIDDEQAILRSFELALEETPYRVDTAESGEKGIALEREHKYDLIFLDLKMPGINGVETLREIRKANPKVPVYIVTAFYGEFLEELKMFEQEGISFEVLRKPIGNKEIAMVAKSLLDGPLDY